MKNENASRRKILGRKRNIFIARMLTLFVISTLMCAGIVYIFADTLTADVTAREETVLVPSLVGMSCDEVAALSLDPLSYDIRINVDESSGADAGTVTAQYPNAWSEAKIVRGSMRCKIELTVAASDEGIDPELLVGESYRTAQLRLGARGMSVHSEFVHDAADFGKIVDASMGENNSILLRVSSSDGMQSVLIPDLSGKNRNEAVKSLLESGFSRENICFRYEKSVLASDTVIAQNLRCGMRTSSCARIMLSLSAGKI